MRLFQCENVSLILMSIKILFYWKLIIIMMRILNCMEVINSCVIVERFELTRKGLISDSIFVINLLVISILGNFATKTSTGNLSYNFSDEEFRHNSDKKLQISFPYFHTILKKTFLFNFFNNFSGFFFSFRISTNFQQNIFIIIILILNFNKRLMGTFICMV